MYDYSGIIHHCLSKIIHCLVYSIILIIFLFRKSKKEPETIKRNRTIMILTISIFALWVGFYGWKCFNPSIESHEGYFWKETAPRNTGVFGNWRYSFTNHGDSKRVFYLDSFSKKKIFNEDFDYNSRYRIYYDKHTKVIVRIEVLYKG